MTTRILGKTSTGTGTMIWASVNTLEYGINDAFCVKTLQCEGAMCDCVDNESIAEYNEIADSIRDAAKNVQIKWI